MKASEREPAICTGAFHCLAYEGILETGVVIGKPLKGILLSAQDCLDRGSVETARAILQHAISVFPGKKSLYRALAHLERQHGTPQAVAEVLERGVKYCPQVCCSLRSPHLYDLIQMTGRCRPSCMTSAMLRFSAVDAFCLLRPYRQR